MDKFLTHIGTESRRKAWLSIIEEMKWIGIMMLACAGALFVTRYEFFIFGVFGGPLLALLSFWNKYEMLKFIPTDEEIEQNMREQFGTADKPDASPTTRN